MRCSFLVSQICLMRSLILLIGFMAAYMSSAADTSQLQAVRCNVLGALAADPTQQSKPVTFEQIEPAALTDACSAAIAETDDAFKLGRYYLHLGRGLLRGGDASDAMIAFQMSAEYGYPAGYFALGVAYLLGEDVQQDEVKAEFLLNLALKKHVVWAAKALAMLHNNKGSALYDPKRAEEYSTLFKERTF